MSTTEDVNPNWDENDPSTWSPIDHRMRHDPRWPPKSQEEASAIAMDCLLADLAKVGIVEVRDEGADTMTTPTTDQPTPPAAVIPYEAVDKAAETIWRNRTGVPDDAAWPDHVVHHMFVEQMRAEARAALRAALPHLPPAHAPGPVPVASEDSIILHRSVWGLICTLLNDLTINDRSVLDLVEQAMAARPVTAAPGLDEFAQWFDKPTDDPVEAAPYQAYKRAWPGSWFTEPTTMAQAVAQFLASRSENHHE